MNYTIEELEIQAKFHEEQAIEHAKLASNYRCVVQDLKSNINGTVSKVVKVDDKLASTNLNANQKSLGLICVEFLKRDDSPKKTRDLYEHYLLQADKTEDELPYVSFSGRLSQFKKIKKHTFDGQPNDSKYYNGLVEWFDGKELRAEFINRITDIKKIKSEQLSMI